VLRLTFYATCDQNAAQVRASRFRLCADSTLRANDNSLAATRVEGAWLIGRRSFRRFDCAGPVMLIVRRTARQRPITMGPFRMVRAGSALIWGDDELLSLRLPGWCGGEDAAWEVALVEAGTAAEG
jgi:hypothetical protein